MAAQTQTTKCNQPTCSEYFDDFSGLDVDGNGVLNSGELGVMNFQRRSFMGYNYGLGLGLDDWKTEQISCLVNATLAVIPFSISSSGYELSDGLPMVVYLAADLRYTMCTDCPRFQQETDRRYTKYLQERENMAARGMTEECQKAQQGGVPFDALEVACANERTDCDSGICQFMQSYMVPSDEDLDLGISVSELEVVAVPFGLTGILGKTQETYECMRTHAPRCFDLENGTKPSIGSVLLFGAAIFAWPADDLSRCTDCPSYVEHLAKATAPDP